MKKAQAFSLFQEQQVFDVRIERHSSRDRLCEAESNSPCVLRQLSRSATNETKAILSFSLLSAAFPSLLTRSPVHKLDEFNGIAVAKGTRGSVNIGTRPKRRRRPVLNALGRLELSNYNAVRCGKHAY